MLHFVQDDDGVGQAPIVGGQAVLEGIDELVRGDLRDARKLLAQHGFGVTFRRGEVGNRRQQRLSDHRAHVEVVEFASEIPPGCLDSGANLVVDAVLLQPKAEAGLGVALWQFRGLEHDAQQRQPHAAARAGAQRARSGVQTTGPPPKRGELDQLFPHIVGQLGDAARGCAVLGEGVVGP